MRQVHPSSAGLIGVARTQRLFWSQRCSREGVQARSSEQRARLEAGQGRRASSARVDRSLLATSDGEAGARADLAEQLASAGDGRRVGLGPGAFCRGWSQDALGPSGFVNRGPSACRPSGRWTTRCGSWLSRRRARRPGRPERTTRPNQATRRSHSMTAALRMAWRGTPRQPGRPV